MSHQGGHFSPGHSTMAQYNGTMQHRSASQEINNNTYTASTESAGVPRQARAGPRQYLMQVNGVQVTPLPSPTTLVFQGHFTAIEADSPVFALRANRNNGDGSIGVRRRAQAVPNVLQSTGGGGGGGDGGGGGGTMVRAELTTKIPVPIQRTNDSCKYKANHGNHHGSLINSGPGRAAQCQLVKQTILHNPAYNPSCMYSKVSPSKSDVKSISDLYDITQFWKSNQGNCMDILGAERSTNNNSNNQTGKLGSASAPQGNELPNIGSFLEYLEEI